MKRQRLLPFIAAVLVLSTVRPAAADTVVTGSIGRVFSGDVEEGVTSYGAAIGFMGDGILGFEVEGTYTPDFFGDTPGGNNSATLMGNLLLGAPIGQSARIYATGGLGLMKFRVKDADEFFDVNRNDFGVNVGGGVIVYFGQTVGVRGDVRYFRDVHESTSGDFDVDFGGFHYWRGAVGLSFRF
jgi:outer membrane protein with beta-barrel domain